MGGTEYDRLRDKANCKKSSCGLAGIGRPVIWGVSTLRPASADIASASGEASLSQKLGTNEERVEFLQSFGWEVDETPVSETEVAYPGRI